MLLSEEYREVLRETHKQSKGTWGAQGRHEINNVVALIDQYRPLTLLDYGAGNGSLTRALSQRDDVDNLKILEYEPADSEKDRRPLFADVVVCLDVLEHVEEECVDAVLRDIFLVMMDAGYITISTRLAKKILSDGRNAHLTVRPPEWWRERLEQYFVITTQRFDKAGQTYRVWVEPKMRKQKSRQ